MGKFEKKKTKKTRKGLLLAVILIIAAILLALFVIPQVLYRLNNGQISDDEAFDSYAASAAAETDAIPETADNSSTAAVSSVEFPCLLEDEKLKIDSVFQFDGINPDSGNQQGANIATITITNLSDTYLESAELSVTTDSGEVLRFLISDLPAGKTALAFSTDNASVDQSATYTDIACASVFNTGASMHEDQVTVTVEGTKVTLKNNTSEELANIVVYCHASLGDQLFGGITYNYTVNNLPAYGTAEIDAVECFLGLTEVVRIAINES